MMTIYDVLQCACETICSNCLCFVGAVKSAGFCSKIVRNCDRI